MLFRYLPHFTSQYFRNCAMESKSILLEMNSLDGEEGGGGYRASGSSPTMQGSGGGRGRAARSACPCGTAGIVGVVLAALGVVLLGVIAGNTRTGGALSGGAAGDGSGSSDGKPAAGADPLVGLQLRGAADSGFFAAHTTLTRPGFVLSVPEAMLEAPLIITNLISKASGRGNDVLHTMLSYDTPVVYFALSPDGLSVDLKEKQLSLRTSNPEYDALLEKGAWNGWLHSFPVLTTAPLRVDFAPFILNRTRIMPANPGPPGAPLGRLVSCQIYPQNMEIEVRGDGRERVGKGGDRGLGMGEGG